jgi:hypothetical protein
VGSKAVLDGVERGSILSEQAAERAYGGGVGVRILSRGDGG